MSDPHALPNLAAHDDPGLAVLADPDSKSRRCFVKVRARLLESLHDDIRQMRARFLAPFWLSNRVDRDAVWWGSIHQKTELFYEIKCLRLPWRTMENQNF